MTPDAPRVPLRERQAYLHLQYGELDVRDSAVVLTDKTGVRMQIPIATLACLMLEPGTTVTHAAVKACADVDCLLIWCGEGGVRFYAVGNGGAARADKMMRQLKLASGEGSRLAVVREMFRRRFGDSAPERRSVDQLRGLEGARVRETYARLASEHGLDWKGRRYDPNEWKKSNDINRAISSANACLYAMVESAVLVAGYNPAIGFLHAGRPLSFVYDVADLYKFETSVPVAFAAVATGSSDVEREVRHRLRDQFRSTKLMERVILDMEDILDVGDRP